MAYGQLAPVYDRLMEDMPYGEWLSFLEQAWSRLGKSPASVADLGCGTGSITIPLAEQGMRVFGIDLSEDMLAVAVSKSDRKAAGAVRTERISWLQQDIREWELPQPVDCAISLCDSLNYLTEEGDIASAFRSTFANLADSGVFIFDVLTLHQFRTYGETQPFVLDEEDIAYIWTCDWDEEACVIEHALTIFAKESCKRNGKTGSDGCNENTSEMEPLVQAKSSSHRNDRFLRFEESHVERGYSLDWLEEQLRLAGFSSVERYGDFGWDAPDETTERAFFIAMKS